MLLLDLFVVVAVLSFAVGKGRSALTVFGLSSRSRWAAMKTGLMGYMAVFPWLFLLLFLTMEISNRLGFQPPIEAIHRLVFLEQRPWVLALTGLLACVVGPIAEEFLFRGVLYPTIRRQAAAPLAMIITGAVFALIHTNVIGFLPITLLGGLLAYVYERTGSLLAPMAVHVIHNTLLMSLAMIYRQLGLHG
jgi:membrane protease YdiL (CAAX protease family)